MKIGKDFIGIGLGAVIVNKKGKIFLSKRGPEAQNERGKWECPGGALEFGETFEKALIREIKEEFGFEIKVKEAFKPFNHLIPEEKQHWVALAFICIVESGKPKILEPEKSAAIGWFTLKEMEKMDLTLPAKCRLKQIKEKYPEGLPDFYLPLAS